MIPRKIAALSVVVHITTMSAIARMIITMLTAREFYEADPIKRTLIFARERVKSGAPIQNVMSNTAAELGFDFTVVQQAVTVLGRYTLRTIPLCEQPTWALVSAFNLAIETYDDYLGEGHA